MSCTTCYKDYISCGIDAIVLSTGVTEITDYSVVITTPTGAKYGKTYTSNIFGDVTIPFTDFPTGLFNPYSGPFLLNIDIGCDDFLFCDYYKYFQFEMVNGNQGKNTLICCTPGENIPTMNCCTTTTQTFANEAVTVVPYTGTRPTIEVAYLNPDNTFTLGGMGIMTNIIFTATEFTIDHGGISSGIIKLLK